MDARNSLEAVALATAQHVILNIWRQRILSIVRIEIDGPRLVPFAPQLPAELLREDLRAAPLRLLHDLKNLHWLFRDESRYVSARAWLANHSSSQTVD
jgi:hypothetical protein